MKTLLSILTFCFSLSTFAKEEKSLKKLMIEEKEQIQEQKDRSELKTKVDQIVDGSGSSKNIVLTGDGTGSVTSSEQVKRSYVPLRDNGLKVIENNPPFDPNK